MNETSAKPGEAMDFQPNPKHLVCVSALLVMIAAAGPVRAQSTEPTSRPVANTTLDPSLAQNRVPTTIPVAAATAPSTLPSTAAAGSDLTDLSLEDLMNVQVTSVSKTPERIADAPGAVTVISQEDMQASGLNGIPEILRLSPGLFVQQGNQFTGWSISSRGFGGVFSNKLLVLQDGRTLYTPMFSGVYWNTVDYPIADLDRIEVVRGPGGTLWGANAVNGVINITSKQSKDTQGLLVDSRVGTDESDLTVRYGGQINKDTYYRVYAKGRSYGDSQFSPDPKGQNDQWQDSREGFRIDHYNGKTDTLTLQGDSFYQNAADTQYAGSSKHYSYDYRNGQNILGRWSHVVSDTSDFSLQMYYDRTKFRDVFETYEGNTFDLDFQHHFELMPGHQMLYGLGARAQTDNNGTNFLAVPLVSPTARDPYVFNAFLQDTITLIPDRLHLILGAKVEANNYTGPDLQPSGRLLWTPTEQTSVWAAVSQAVRTPSRLEWDENFRTIVSVGGGRFARMVESSDHPDDEKLLAYEIGARHQIAKNASIDVTGFVNSYSDLIALQDRGTALVPSANPPLQILSQYANDQAATTYGIEIAGKWKVAPNWRLAASYSLLIANAHDTRAGVTPNALALQDASPQNQFQFHSYWTVIKNVDFNQSLYYVQGTGGTNVVKTAGQPPSAYTRVDLGLTWHPHPNLDITVGVQNAFDAHHLESPYNAAASSFVDRSAYAEVQLRL
jgi:iron complex outermembrane receptor protein